MRLTSFTLVLGVLLGGSASCAKQRRASTVAQVGPLENDGGKDCDAPSVEPVAVDSTKILLAIEAIGNMRKKVAVDWEPMRGVIAQDPEAGAERIMTLLRENFVEHPRVDDLFGPELASLDPDTIKRTFELYERVNRLRTDLATLAAFVDSNADALRAGGGPAVFGVVFNKTGAVLVKADAPLCGSRKLTPDSLGPCDEPSKAVAYQGGPSLTADESSIIRRGRRDGEMQLLVPQGAIYRYAIGLEPDKHALRVMDTMVRRIQEHLEAIAQAETKALQTLRGE